MIMLDWNIGLDAREAYWLTFPGVLASIVSFSFFLTLLFFRVLSSSRFFPLHSFVVLIFPIVGLSSLVGIQTRSYNPTILPFFGASVPATGIRAVKPGKWERSGIRIAGCNVHVDDVRKRVLLFLFPFYEAEKRPIILLTQWKLIGSHVPCTSKIWPCNRE